MKLFTISKKEVSSEIIHENTVFVYIFFSTSAKCKVSKNIFFLVPLLYIFFNSKNHWGASRNLIGQKVFLLDFFGCFAQLKKQKQIFNIQSSSSTNWWRIWGSLKKKLNKKLSIFRQIDHCAASTPSTSTGSLGQLPTTPANSNPTQNSANANPQ